MPNMKNAKKAVKVISKRAFSNNEYEASMKTAFKNVERAVASKDKAKAEDALKVAKFVDALMTTSCPSCKLIPISTANFA